MIADIGYPRRTWPYQQRALYLFQFDQRSLKILRVQEQHRLAVRADFRLPIAQDARARLAELVARGKIMSSTSKQT